MYPSVTTVTTDSTVAVVFHITVKVVAADSAVTTLSVVIAVTLIYTLLFQHSHYHCCHNAVLVFAASALRSFSRTHTHTHTHTFDVLTTGAFIILSTSLWSSD